MEPKRGLLIRQATIGRYTLPSDTPVWIFASNEEFWEVEYRDVRGRVQHSAVIESPVPKPSLAQLRRLDGCFGLGEDAFEDHYVDSENCFAILRCRAHGRFFLRDTRGTIALYQRLTLLAPDDGENWMGIWSRYHAMSDDWLNLKARTW